MLFRGAVNDMGTRLPSLARVGDPAADEERRGQDRSWAHVQARKTAQKRRHLISAILAAIDGEAAESDALGDPSQVANARRELKDAHDGFYFAKYEADALFSERLWYQTMLSSPLVSTISTFAQAHLVPPERRAQLTSLADKFNEIGLRCLERIDAINVHFAQRAVPTMYGQAPPGSGGIPRRAADAQQAAGKLTFECALRAMVLIDAPAAQAEALFLLAAHSSTKKQLGEMRNHLSRARAVLDRAQFSPLDQPSDRLLPDEAEVAALAQLRIRVSLALCWVHSRLGDTEQALEMATAGVGSVVPNEDAHSPGGRGPSEDGEDYVPTSLGGRLGPCRTRRLALWRSHRLVVGGGGGVLRVARETDDADAGRRGSARLPNDGGRFWIGTWIRSLASGRRGGTGSLRCSTPLGRTRCQASAGSTRSRSSPTSPSRSRYATLTRPRSHRCLAPRARRTAPPSRSSSAWDTRTTLSTCT